MKKDPGIPNLFPYKNKLLQQVEQSKRRKEDDALRKREEHKERRKQLENAGDVVEGEVAMTDGVDTGEPEDVEALLDFEQYSDEDSAMQDNPNPMAALIASAADRAQDYEAQAPSDKGSESSDLESDAPHEPPSSSTNAHASSSRRAPAMQTLHQLINTSDVLLYVLDARDPPGTRSTQIEQQITFDPDKRLILVLNKIDLVPTAVLSGWLSFLRRSHLTLPIRASQGSGSSNVHSFSHGKLNSNATTSTLLKALKSYAGNPRVAARSKGSLRIGVLGYPNVGKSSIINALMSRFGSKHDVCPAGAEAGITTALREVKLDSRIRLVDAPGYILPSSATADGGGASQPSSDRRSQKADEHARLILLNAVPPREIEDVMPAVSLLLRRLSSSKELLDALKMTYSIPALNLDGDTTNDLLIHVARQRGRLGRGGIPNLQAAAQTVVNDWRDGRIMGWVGPPSQSSAAAKGDGGRYDQRANGDEKVLTSQWAKEFNLDELLNEDLSSSV